MIFADRGGEVGTRSEEKEISIRIVDEERRPDLEQPLFAQRVSAGGYGGFYCSLSVPYLGLCHLFVQWTRSRSSQTLPHLRNETLSYSPRLNLRI